MAVAEVPGTLTEANALPNFTDPTNPWPAGSWVNIGGGTSGQPLQEVHWNQGTTAFVLGRTPDNALDLTEDILGEMHPLAANVTALAADSSFGNGRLSAADAKKFDTGAFVQLSSGASTGKAYYNSGQSGAQQPGTGAWVAGASPADAPDVITGVTVPTSGALEADWLPAGAEGPATFTEANTRLVAGSPANGFVKPTAAWPTGAYILCSDGTTHIHWQQTTTNFATGNSTGT